jgi:hypothetical protein
MWPSVAKIVNENKLGTAYGSMFTIQNWGLGLFFWGIGALLDFVNPKVLAAYEGARKLFEGQGLTEEAITLKVNAMKEAGDLPPMDYTTPILILVACGVISIFLAFKLKQADRKQGFGLELPSND